MATRDPELPEPLRQMQLRDGSYAKQTAAKTAERTISIGEDCPPELYRESWSVEDFVFKKQIYSGRTSLVYHAVERQTGITVALKMYRRAKMNDFERYQVAREITLHAQIHHSSIIAMYASWKDADFIYLALEWASGGDLYDYLHRSGGKIQEHVAIPVVLEPTMSAFRHLHEKGIIHRDIKPENILLTKTCQVKIADFGLSISDQNEVANTRLGSLLYIAPEVLECPTKKHPLENKDNPDRSYSKKVDCWGVGILAYEVLVGTTPFTGDSIPEIVNQIRTKEVQYPDYLSPGAVDFISSALERDPHKRPTIQQLICHPWIESFRNKRTNLGESLRKTQVRRNQSEATAQGRPALAHMLPELALTSSDHALPAPHTHESPLSSQTASIDHPRGTSRSGRFMAAMQHGLAQPLPQQQQQQPTCQTGLGGLIITKDLGSLAKSPHPPSPRPPSSSKPLGGGRGSDRGGLGSDASSYLPASLVSLVAEPQYGTVLPRVASTPGPVNEMYRPGSQANAASRSMPHKGFSLRSLLRRQHDK